MTQNTGGSDSLPLPAREYPKPYTFEQDGVTYTGELNLCALVGDEVAPNQYFYQVVEALFYEGQVLGYVNVLGSGVFNPTLVH